MCQRRLCFRTSRRHLMDSRAIKVCSKSLQVHANTCCRHNFLEGVCTCMLPKPTQSSRVRAASANNVLHHSPKNTKVTFACTKCAIASPTCPSYAVFSGISAGGPISRFVHGFTWSFTGILGHSRLFHGYFTVPSWHTILQTQYFQDSYIGQDRIYGVHSI